MPISHEQLQRRRLVLGKESQECLATYGGGCTLSSEQLEMDEALEAIYAADDAALRRAERFCGNLCARRWILPRN